MAKRKTKSKKKPLNKNAIGALALGAIVLGAMSMDPEANAADQKQDVVATSSSKPSLPPTKGGGSTGLSKHMKDIRFCESTDDYKAVNKESPSHTGAFQFADSTWAEYKTGYKHAMDAPKSVQDKIAMEEYAKNGNSPWLASKPCWSKR